MITCFDGGEFGKEGVRVGLLRDHGKIVLLTVAYVSGPYKKVAFSYVRIFDLKRMRQYEVRKKLDELYKVELVKRVKV